MSSEIVFKKRKMTNLGLKVEVKLRQLLLHEIFQLIHTKTKFRPVNRGSLSSSRELFNCFTYIEGLNMSLIRCCCMI